MAYRTCVTIATRSPDKLRSLLAKYLRKSDYAEIRFDFIHPNGIPEAAGSVKKYFDRCVCTVRGKSEGGRYRDNEISRTARLEFISGYRPYMLDVEYSALKRDADFRRHIKDSGANILVSWHNFVGTPKLDYLRERMESMLEFSNNVKIVTMAKSKRDAANVLSLYNYAPRGVNLIAFAMGQPGKESRIKCMDMGSPFTYVSLGKPVAPGQFSLAEIKPMLKGLQGTDA